MSHSASHVQPPIAVFGTPGRYASALFSAASKAKALPTAQKELTEVRVFACKHMISTSSES